MKKIMIFVLMCSACAFATVDDPESIRQYFTIGPATDEFIFTQPVTSSDDVFVYKKDISTDATLKSPGTETLLTITTDYTIVATGGDYLNGGTVTTNSALGVDFQLVIVRTIKKSQETSQGAITPTSVVTALDKLTRTVQDLQDQSDRSWRLPQSDATTFDVEMPTLADRAETFPFFNASGVLTYVSDLVTNSETASAFGVSLMQSANALAGRVLLELTTSDAVEFAALTATTGAFSGSVTLAAGADFIGSATSDIAIGGSGTEKFTVAGATGNTVIAGTGTLTVAGVATLGAASELASSPATADDSTKIATTAYVQANIGFGVYTSDSTTTQPMIAGEAYTARQDGFVTVLVQASGVAVSIVTGKIGASNRVRDQAVISGWAGFTMPVANGEAFTITTTGSPGTVEIVWRGAQTTLPPTGP